MEPFFVSKASAHCPAQKVRTRLSPLRWQHSDGSLARRHQWALGGRSPLGGPPLRPWGVSRMHTCTTDGNFTKSAEVPDLQICTWLLDQSQCRLMEPPRSPSLGFQVSALPSPSGGPTRTFYVTLVGTRVFHIIYPVSIHVYTSYNSWYGYLLSVSKTTCRQTANSPH